MSKSSFKSEMLKQLCVMEEHRDEMIKSIEEFRRMIENMSEKDVSRAFSSEIVDNDDEAIKLQKKLSVVVVDTKIKKTRQKSIITEEDQCCALLYKYEKGGAKSQRCSRKKVGEEDFCNMHHKKCSVKFSKGLPTQSGKAYVFEKEGEYYYGKKCLFTKKSGYKVQRPFKVEYVWQIYGAINQDFVAVDMEGIEYYRGSKAFFFKDKEANGPAASKKEIKVNDTVEDTDKDTVEETTDDSSNVQVEVTTEDSSNDQVEDASNEHISTESLIDILKESDNEHDSEEEESEDESEDELEIVNNGCSVDDLLGAIST